VPAADLIESATITGRLRQLISMSGSISFHLVQSWSRRRSALTDDRTVPVIVTLVSSSTGIPSFWRDAQHVGSCEEPVPIQQDHLRSEQILDLARTLTFLPSTALGL
jgi:hypothetical protein